jgi:hypothetical protein
MSITTIATIHKTKTAPTADENKKHVANHRKTSQHLKAASEYHLEAAKHHEEGNHEKASQSTVASTGQLCLANDCYREDVKHHAE